MISRRKIISFLFILVLCTLCIGCGSTNQAVAPVASPAVDKEVSDKSIHFSGNGIQAEATLTIKEMLEIPGAKYEHLYSTINNYPTKKKYAARGIKLEKILEKAGMKKKARSIAFIAPDGYKYSFTKEQLFGTPRYYYPGILQEDPAGAIQVAAILAYEYMENSDNLNSVQLEAPTLIFGQANVKEQTNFSYVKDVNKVVISTDEPGKWDLATAFPQPGNITRGETVKLQHKDIGTVKMYYTLDGSIPTEKSTLYNLSTYQPELNKPIPIEKDTTIKVLVKGFGKEDSDVVALNYKIK